MKRMIVGFFVALTLASPSAIGGTYYGAGVGSCGEWLEARESGNYYTHGQWILGFLSALTFMGTEMADTDSRAIVAWMDSYCREHPLDDLVTATSSLAFELMDRAK